MNVFKRIFGKRSGAQDATAADRARSQQLAGRETGQTTGEQAATRGRMEAELDAQRERRAAAAAPCPHTALTAHWDSVADMGNDEKATSYTCQSCNQSFTPAEGRALRATEAERVRRELSTEPGEP